MIYKALKHKETGEWGYVDEWEQEISASNSPECYPAKILESSFSIYKHRDNYELVPLYVYQESEIDWAKVATSFSLVLKIYHEHHADTQAVKLVEVLQANKFPVTVELREVNQSNENLIDEIENAIYEWDSDISRKDLLAKYIASKLSTGLREVGEVPIDEHWISETIGELAALEFGYDDEDAKAWAKAKVLPELLPLLREPIKSNSGLVMAGLVNKFGVMRASEIFPVLEDLKLIT